jgi:5-methylcytosine-specific restriction endonuclease McrA
MRKIQSGKTTKEDLKRRREWIKANPPNHQGYWVCYLCRQWVHETGMELDHVEPRGLGGVKSKRMGELRPTHGPCNRDKGSKRITDSRLDSDEQAFRDLGKW